MTRRPLSNGTRLRGPVGRLGKSATCWPLQVAVQDAVQNAVQKRCAAIPTVLLVVPFLIGQWFEVEDQLMLSHEDLFAFVSVPALCFCFWVKTTWLLSHPTAPILGLLGEALYQSLPEEVSSIYRTTVVAPRAHHAPGCTRLASSDGFPLKWNSPEYTKVSSASVAPVSLFWAPAVESFLAVRNPH